jgi:hypothetical protein
VTPRIPGELPSDGYSLACDHGWCDACGHVALLVAGGDLCERCDVIGRAVSQNLHRRHLTTSQRAQIAAGLVPMFEREARARQSAAGGSHPGPLRPRAGFSEIAGMGFHGGCSGV